MFPDNICQNVDVLEVQKNNFGYHSNQNTQGHKHRLNNLYFKYYGYSMKLKHLSFLQFRLFFHKPHCIINKNNSNNNNNNIYVYGFFYSFHV